jgi:starvation-inducible DNA-binding protein
MYELVLSAGKPLVMLAFPAVCFSKKGTNMARNERAMAMEISQENEAGNAVVQHLQRELANAFVLYSNYKHYHWQTFGPLFRDLHLLFDDLATQVLATADELAERVRMIGQNPVYELRHLQETASVQAASPHGSMRDMIEEADANLQVVIKGMRDAVKAAEQQNDPGTVDLFSRTVQIHEKAEWFLRAILRRDDGLTV